jgi:glycosyltransferase involved in cell wall biosynthesis
MERDAPRSRRDSVRVLYLNPFSQQVSGPDESLITLLGHLVQHGIEAHLVLPRPGPQVSRYTALGVKIHYAPLTVLRRRMSAADVALLVPRLIRGVLAVGRIVRRERIDLIHTNMEVVLDGAVVSRLLGIPHVLHYRGNTLDRPRWAFEILTRLWTRTAEKVVCISKATADVFRKRGLGAKVEALYDPVDVDRFSGAARSDSVRKELGAGTEDLLVGTVARLHPRKDIATFLRAGALAAERIPNLRLVIVGSAEAPEEHHYREHLLELAEELGIVDRLTWAGARRDIPNVRKALDLFVLCSRHEGLGLVTAEAMAAGTPSVLSAEGGPLELSESGRCASLASPGQPRSFARAIVELGTSLQRRRELASTASSSVRRFATADIADAVEALYAAAAASDGR